MISLFLMEKREEPLSEALLEVMVDISEELGGTKGFSVQIEDLEKVETGMFSIIEETENVEIIILLARDSEDAVKDLSELPEGEYTLERVF